MPCDIEAKPRLLWLQGVTCNGNTHSFLNLPHLDELINKFEIISHPILESTISFEEITKCKAECDILIFEGAYDPLLKRNDVIMNPRIRIS